MNGDQKLDAYAQERQDFIQHFSQIVRVLTEEDIGHPETGDAITRLKEVRDLQLERVNLCNLCACVGSLSGSGVAFDRCGNRLLSESPFWRERSPGRSNQSSFVVLLVRHTALHRCGGP